MKKKIAIVIGLVLCMTACSKKEEVQLITDSIIDMPDDYYLEPSVHISIQDLSKLVCLNGSNPFEGRQIELSLNELNYSDKWCDFEFDTTLETMQPEVLNLYASEILQNGEIQDGVTYYRGIKNGSLLGLDGDASSVEVEETLEETENQTIETVTEETTNNIENKDLQTTQKNEYVVWCFIDSVELLNSQAIENESVEQTTDSLTGTEIISSNEPTSEVSQVDNVIPTEYQKHLVDGNKRYKVHINKIEYVNICPEDFTNIDGETPIEVIEPMTQMELQEFIQKDQQEKQEKLRAEEQRRQEEEHRQKLNAFSKQELATYIRNKEKDISSLQNSSNSNFILNNGAIMGLTETGLKQTELVIGQYNIPNDSKFWEQLRKSTSIKSLVFKGNYYKETTVLDPETENEKWRREHAEEVLPPPSHIETSYGLTIPTNALKDCKSIVEIYLPDGVSNIGTEAFANCESLRYIRMPTHCKTIQNNILTNTKIVDLIMPYYISEAYSTDSLTGCEELVNLVFISHSAPSVGVLDENQYIFKDCNKLERVAIDRTESLDKWNLKYQSDWFSKLKLITE